MNASSNLVFLVATSNNTRTEICCEEWCFDYLKNLQVAGCHWERSWENRPMDVGCLLKHNQIYCFGFTVSYMALPPQGERWLRHFVVPWQQKWVMGESVCMLKFYWYEETNSMFSFSFIGKTIILVGSCWFRLHQGFAEPRLEREIPQGRVYPQSMSTNHLAKNCPGFADWWGKVPDWCSDGLRKCLQKKPVLWLDQKHPRSYWQAYNLRNAFPQFLRYYAGFPQLPRYHSEGHSGCAWPA